MTEICRSLIFVDHFQKLERAMILPASAQILLHSSVLIWTAYYLITKPSTVLESTIVVLIGHAVQMVTVFLRCVLSSAEILDLPVRGARSIICGLDFVIPCTGGPDP